MRTSAVIFGAGGHARVVRSLCGHRYSEIFTVTTAGGPDVLDERTVYDRIDDYRSCDFYVAIGANEVRRRIFDRLDALGVNLATCVAENAFIASDAQLGRGVVVCPGAVVMTGAVLADNVIVNTLSSVDHDCRVGEHSQITAGVTFGGTTTVGANCFFGIKSATVPNVTLGDNTVVMAGALVVRDCKGDVTLGGSPARVVKSAAR